MKRLEFPRAHWHRESSVMDAMRHTRRCSRGAIAPSHPSCSSTLCVQSRADTSASDASPRASRDVQNGAYGRSPARVNETALGRHRFQFYPGDKRAFTNTFHATGKETFDRSYRVVS
jgi:hypothetical protein